MAVCGSSGIIAVYLILWILYVAQQCVCYSESLKELVSSYADEYYYTHNVV